MTNLDDEAATWARVEFARAVAKATPAPRYPGQPSDTMRYTVTVWHGEGRSTFAVLDMAAPESEQPAVVSFHDTREAAEGAVAALTLAAKGRALDELAGALDRADFARKVRDAWKRA